MSKERINITLDPGAIAVLDRVGNRSGYLSAIVRQRWDEWNRALRSLTASGWSPTEIGLVCEVLVGAWLEPHERVCGRSIARAIAESERTYGTATACGLVDGWVEDIGRSLTGSSGDLYARWLHDLSREIAAGNEGCKSAIESGGRP